MSCLFLSLLAISLSSFAESPVLEHLFPAGGERNSTNIVTFSGKFEPWPPQVWVAAPGLHFIASTNKNKFRVEVTPDAPLGPHLVRIFNNDGASEPRFFIVGSGHEVLDAEPNDDFDQAQKLDSLPVTVNGRLDKNGDVDSFAVHLEKGRWLIGSVDAYTLESKVDAVLRLVDAHGHQLAYNHDYRTLDPLLAWQAPESGVYILQIMGFQYPAGSDVQLGGGEGYVYRLLVSTEPFIRYSIPSHVKRNAATAVHLLGWNLGTGEAMEKDWTVDTHTLPLAADSASFKLSDRMPEFSMPLGEIPEIVENEPNNQTNEIQTISVPSIVHGCIDPVGDTDRFLVALHKDQTIEVKAETSSLGFPLTPWLRLEDQNQKDLAHNNDNEPRIEWKAPTDGRYTLVIGNLLHKGGTPFRYRLTVAEATPDFTTELSTSAFKAEAGRTNEVKLSIKKLRGFGHKLSIAMKGLPEGVDSEPVEVPEKGGEVTLKLIAKENAPPYNGTVALVTTDESTREIRLIKALFTTTSVNNGVPGGYTDLVIDGTDRLWLTVLPKRAEAKPEEAKK